jgi:glycosyltransferase involved in cell wall biosynthesis
MDNYKRLNVCYIYQDQYPWDIRVDKITATLASKGASVHILSRNRDGLPVKERISDNIVIHRLSAAFNNWSRNLMNFPAFFSPFWLKAIIDTIHNEDINIIIVRDLPLAPAAYIAGLLTKRPVLLDMAENYPALIQSMWTFRGQKLIDYVIRNPILLRWLERAVLPRMDGILVVSSYSGKRVDAICGGKQSIWVVGNTPIIGEKKSQGEGDASRAKTIRARSSLILIYVGFVEAHRGLDTPIRAIAYIAKKRPDILLVIVGKGGYEAKYKELARELGIENNVLFTGWVQHEQINDMINIADIGLIPHYITEHTDTTLPNKIFDYMAQGKPVIVTQSKALIDVVNNANCGMVYKDTSPEELVNVIEKMSDRELRTILGANGREAIKREYNWDRESKRLWTAMNAIYDTKVHQIKTH